MATRKKARQRVEPFEPQAGPWTERVSYSANGPYAFRPRQLLCTGNATREAAVRLITKRLAEQGVKDPRVDETRLFDQEEEDEEWLLETPSELDVDFIVAELRHRGFRVEPNQVFFAHSVLCGCSHCGCGQPGCGHQGYGHQGYGHQGYGHQGYGHQANPFTATPFTATPFTATPFTATPFTATPFTATPFTATPFTATPFTATPFTATPFTATGERPSSARPADKPEMTAPTLPPKMAKAIVLDSGIAAKAQLPAMLNQPTHVDALPRDRDAPDESGDGYLDPVSGHGTFIAGIIEQLAPGQEVHVASVLTTFGDGDAASIAWRLNQLRRSNMLNKATVLNMSFGGYADADMSLLARAIRLAQAEGAVVVASAGNDSTCMPTYPACLPGVISVGSIEPHGKAFYSNFGSWVRACAPGTDLISAFYKSFDGKMDPVMNGADPDEFREWAMWTGTSFAAPVVVAALMRHIALTGSTAKEAVAAVIDAPGLFRFPGLGTVVNLAPGM